MIARLAAGLAAFLAGVAPATVGAQVFLGSRPSPDLRVGPLFVRAAVTPALDPVTVDVYFSLVVAPGKSGAALEQDIYLLWPGAVTGVAKGKKDLALVRFVEERHFSVIDEGTLALSARNFYRLDGERPPEEIPGGASFVTFVREGGALGLTSPATYIHIPWTPKLANRVWLMDLRFTARNMVRLKQATWVEETFWGRRHHISLSFHDLRSRALFPLYFQNRDRVLRLAEEPAQIMINFAHSDRLKIDQLAPSSATRRASDSLESTEVVSLFLDPATGLTPQVLTVQFGYFTRMQSWMPVLIPTLFFVLGNLAGPIVQRTVTWVGRRVSSRVHVGRVTDGPPGKARGVVISGETLARIVPGDTTYDDVLRLCGPDAEEHEQLGTPRRRTLVYRGRRIVPQRRRTFGWFATVSHWDVEHHEVEIDVEGDRVRDLQARVTRSRLPSPEGP